jgi:hypothetical protein
MQASQQHKRTGVLDTQNNTWTHKTTQMVYMHYKAKQNDSSRRERGTSGKEVHAQADYQPRSCFACPVAAHN